MSHRGIVPNAWRSERTWVVRSLRPDLAPILSLSLWLLSFFFPPHLVETMLGERDYVFLNLSMAAVVAVSTAAFWAGIRVARPNACMQNIQRSRPQLVVSQRLLSRAFWLAVIVLVVEIIWISVILKMAGLGTILLAMGDSRLGTLWRIGVWDLVRFGGISLNSLGLFCYIALIACAFVVLWARQQSSRRIACLLTVSAGSLLYVVVNLLLFVRWQIMEFVIAMVSILFVSWDLRTGVSRARVISVLTGIVVVFLALFLIVNSLRTDTSGVSMLVGYTIGSYNLGAATIAGHFQQPYAHSSYATLAWLWNAPLVGPSLRELGRALGLKLPPGGRRPSGTDQQEWGTAALAAGLNASLQWPTVFGRIWGDVGVLFPVVFFLYGILCEKVYERFCRLEILGVLLYIPLLINILSWFSSGLLDKRFDGFVLTAFLVWALFKDFWIVAVSEKSGANAVFIRGWSRGVSLGLRTA